MQDAKTKVTTVIVGAGFAGLGMAIRMKQQGFDDFVVLEKANELGGTWRDNTYPGCTCDVESHLYSFSFAPNPRWSRMWSPQPEILAYLKSCAAKSGLEQHLVFNCELKSASWNEANHKWELETSTGKFASQFFISATGALSIPDVPQIPGIASFRGKIFHSARWDHQYSLSGKKVAVIGTGASAIQFIPEIQPQVAHLTIFQRTAPWIVPYNNRELSEREKKWLARFPSLQRLWRAKIFLVREFTGLAFRHPSLTWVIRRFSQNYLHRKVSDPELRKKLTPTYLPGCKRVLVSRRYYSAVSSPNVTLLTEPVTKITENGITLSNGNEEKFDAIILGTGFRLGDAHASKTTHGRNGKALDESWNHSPEAHLGTMVSGFPNLFLLFGPGTGLGHSSVMLMAEAQIELVLKIFHHLKTKGLNRVEPRPESQASFVSELNRRMKGTVWTSGCKSWYLDATGRNSTLWPGSVSAFRRKLRQFRPSQFLLQE